MRALPRHQPWDHENISEDFQIALHLIAFSVLPFLGNEFGERPMVRTNLTY